MQCDIPEYENINGTVQLVQFLLHYSPCTFMLVLNGQTYYGPKLHLADNTDNGKY
jgi:hypothetical protein